MQVTGSNLWPRTPLSQRRMAVVIWGGGELPGVGMGWASRGAGAGWTTEDRHTAEILELDLESELG